MFVTKKLRPKSEMDFPRRRDQPSSDRARPESFTISLGLGRDE